jgi:hypothetical protein
MSGLSSDLWRYKLYASKELKATSRSTGLQCSPAGMYEHDARAQTWSTPMESTGRP